MVRPFHCRNITIVENDNGCYKTPDGRIVYPQSPVTTTVRFSAIGLHVEPTPPLDVLALNAPPQKNAVEILGKPYLKYFPNGRINPDYFYTPVCYYTILY